MCLMDMEDREIISVMSAWQCHGEEIRERLVG